MKKNIVLNEENWKSVALRLELAELLLASVCCSPVFSRLYPVTLTDRICFLANGIVALRPELEDAMYKGMKRFGGDCVPHKALDVSRNYPELIWKVLSQVNAESVSSEWSPLGYTNDDEQT